MPTPPPTETVRARLAALLPELRERYGVEGLSLFGSVARGEQTAASDVDVLATFERTPTLYALGGMTLDLQEALGADVHLAVGPVSDPALRAAIDRERVAIS